MTAIMAALYFHALGPNDKVAVKPHAGPVLHAIHYLLGSQTPRAARGVSAASAACRAYPSRTKDRIPVDFSTGSVGLGVAITAFASLVQDYLVAHGMMAPEETGRMVALMGDAELDEGNIYECLIEAYKHDIRNCWWIVDYNRQSLDATTAERMFRRFDEIFASCGWRVVTLKYGRRCEAAFAREGRGGAARPGSRRCSNADYAALTYLGGAAWRERLAKEAPAAKPILDARDDDALHALMTNLGGHDMAALVEAFDGAAGRRADPVHRLHDQGLRPALRRPQGQSCRADEPRPDRRRCARRWGSRKARNGSPGPGSAATAPRRRRALVETSRDRAGEAGAAVGRRRGARDRRRRRARSNRPRRRSAGSCSICRRAGGAARRPHRHHLARRHRLDQSRRLGEPARPVPPAGPCRRVRRGQNPLGPEMGRRPTAGQHIELGIAENNLFLMLAALGLAGDLFGDAAVPDRHRLRSVHRPRPRCAQLRLLPGCALHAGGDAVGRDAGARRRRPPVDQPAADRARPAGPAALRAGLRRRAGADDGGRLPADAGAGRRERLSAPHHPRDRPGRARRTTAGRRARSPAAIGCARRRRAPRRRSSIAARSRPRRSPPGRR